jgi:hypothetical protein
LPADAAATLVGVAEMCRICRINPADSFEHVPPRKAFNDEPTTSYTIMDWLAREEGGLTGGKIAQRGAGDLVLCQRCNNITGSWYGGELVRAAGAGARILNETPLDELDASLDHAWATVKFKQQPKIGPHPLRLIKQIVAMLLAGSPIGFYEVNPELSEFILERDWTGLPGRFQIYLLLFAGPNARSVGGSASIDLVRGRTDFIVEVAYPPFAYVMTVDSELDAISTANITPFADIGYNQMADLDLGMLVGFGHTPYPADYRTKAMVERDRDLNEREAGAL